MKYVYQGASSRGSKTIKVSNLPSRNTGIWSELTRHVVVLAINSVNVTRTIKKRKPVRTFHGIIIIIAYIYPITPPIISPKIIIAIIPKTARILIAIFEKYHFGGF